MLAALNYIELTYLYSDQLGSRVLRLIQIVKGLVKVLSTSSFHQRLETHRSLVLLSMLVDYLAHRFGYTIILHDLLQWSRVGNTSLLCTSWQCKMSRV